MSGRDPDLHKMFGWPLRIVESKWALFLVFLTTLVGAFPMRVLTANFGQKATWISLQVVYNLFWHPLRKFPGPRHFAASRIPYVYTSFSGRLAVKFQELHKGYGSVVRTAPNELSFVEPSAWKTIYDRKNRHQTPFRKNYDSFNETRSQIRTSMYLAGDHKHAQVRKILSHAFSPDALRNQEPLLQEHVQQLMEGLNHELSNKDGIVDLEKWFTWIAFDIIGDTSFGEPFRCATEPDHRSWPLMLARVRKVITVLSGLKSIAPSFSLLRWLIPGSILQKSVLQHFVNRLEFDLNVVKDRITSEPSRNDVLSSIVQHNKEHRILDNTEIMANASLFILAGTETVATLLSAVTYFLTQNPAALSNLSTEIRGHFNDENPLTMQSLAFTPYLTACIEEAMRLVPPVPEGLPRVTPPEGEQICGQWVPGGVSFTLVHEDDARLTILQTFVQISTLAANTSSSNFTDPLSFIPERWLAVSPLPYASDNKQASQPFSTGPRNCIGQA